MKSKRRSNQVDQRRFVANLALTKQLCRRDVSAAAMRLDPPPVIDALKDVLAIFVNLQFDHYQPAIVPQRQQIDGSRAGRPTMRRAKLRMQRSHNQTGIEFGNVAAEN